MADTAEYGVGRGASRTLGTKARGAERESGHRLLMALLLGFIPLVVLSLLLLFPVTKISRYEVSGETTLTRDEILRWAAIHGTEYLATIDCAHIAANLAAHPQVADASVRRVFPNGVKFVITDRVPVAIALASVDGRTLPVAIDKDGVAFKAISGDPDLPVLSGIRFEGFHYGVRLPDSLLPLLRSLETLRTTNPSLLAAFSEIRLVRRPYGDLELLLYPLRYHVPVRTPTVLNEPLLRSIILVLDVVERQGLTSSISELDFRTGTVIYRVKEGVSG